jgi:hypothetical protein
MQSFAPWPLRHHFNVAVASLGPNSVGLSDGSVVYSTKRLPIWAERISIIRFLPHSSLNEIAARVQAQRVEQMRRAQRKTPTLNCEQGALSNGDFCTSIWGRKCNAGNKGLAQISVSVKNMFTSTY